jgi:hypothetical protein
MKVNNEIKSIAYVPSLIIPGVLCAKSGSSYIDPAGVDFSNKFYRECYYDRKYGEYVAHSKYNNNPAYEYLAISPDGRNWREDNIITLDVFKPCAIANTKQGVLIFVPIVVVDVAEDETMVKISARVYRHTGSTITYDQIYYFDFTVGSLYNVQFTDWDYEIATNGENVVIIYYWCQYTNNGVNDWIQRFYYINLDTNTISDISFLKYDPTEHDILHVWYNTVLKKFFYSTRDGGKYFSDNGYNFTEIFYFDRDKYKVSYGNLNGAEVFEDGISYDGINIAKSYTYRPNAYDPLEGKYIRIETNSRATGEGNKRIYYYDVYESTDLNSWTKVVTKENPTAIPPQTINAVNTDGFACVKGF